MRNSIRIAVAALMAAAVPPAFADVRPGDTDLPTLANLPDVAARSQNPITGISSKMTGVTVDLSQTITGEPVQKTQGEIIGDLDELIAALERECQGCRNGIKRNNPTRGLADSVIKGGTGGIGDLVPPGQAGKDWASLSDRERDRILQSMSEGFPPEYRTVLERYYRRLAEETPAAAVEADADDAIDESEGDDPAIETP